MSFICTDACYTCGKKIVYNALLVPSFADHGVKRPLCRECVEYANPRRVARGLTEIKIWPGTYGPFEDEWREKPDIYRFFGKVE
jgi:hypothetical protein